MRTSENIKNRTFAILLCMISLNVTLPAYSQEIITGGSPLKTDQEYLQYPEQVPGYLGESDFAASSVAQINHLGSFGLSINGIKTVIRTEKYRFLGSYAYRNYDGYRVHSNDYGHTANVSLKAIAGPNSSISIAGSYVSGLVRMPGSLTKTEFANDPFAADPRNVNRDEQRFATRGRLHIGYLSKFGQKLNNEISITGSGKIDFIRRVTGEFKIINRYGLGLEAKWTNKTSILGRDNKFSLGGAIQTQPDKTEIYENYSGQQSDLLEELKGARMNNSNIFLTDNLEIFPEKLWIDLTGRFERQIFSIRDEILPLRTDERTYQAFTPLVKLTYNLSRAIAAYGSYGQFFTLPTEKQLEDSPVPAEIFNRNLNAQTDHKVEFGFRTEQPADTGRVVKKLGFEATIYHNMIDNEIVAYEVYGEEYCRNAARATRFGAELKGSIAFSFGLKVKLSYNFSHFRYDSYAAQSLETDSTGNLVYVPRDFSGNTEPGIPANKLSLVLSYNHHITRNISLLADVGYTAMSGFQVDDANSAKTNASGILDSMLGLYMKFGHFDFSVAGGVNNIFNKTYVGYATINSADKRFYNPGVPRDYHCSLNMGYTF